MNRRGSSPPIAHPAFRQGVDMMPTRTQQLGLILLLVALAIYVLVKTGR
jgi:hypothetical protein